MTEPLVEVRGLQKYFYEQDSLVDQLLRTDPVAIKAVDGLDFDIYEGETLGLVGESGCGKSTTGETILRLQEPTSGSVTFDGRNIYDMGRAELKEFRRNAAIVFQDPFSSLDPRMTIGETVKQPLNVHDWPQGDDHDKPKEQLRRERVRDLLNRVGLSGDQFDRYPHEFSGGQRQRVGIARALALDPDFVVLDEPTSALDVSVQAQILNLLGELQDEFGLTYLLISHDLSVIRHICDRVAVMYLGEIVEIAPSADIFADPQHPYTDALLDSVPRVNTNERERDIGTLTGGVPSPRDPPSGCRFRTRCPSIIPPDDLDISQHLYRDIITLRDRVRNREIDVSGSKEFVEGTDEAVVDLILERTIDADAEREPTHEARVRDAVEAVVDERWVDAEEHLSVYESVCEKVSPKLQDEQDHLAACHLLAQPPAVESAVDEAQISQSKRADD